MKEVVMDTLAKQREQRDKQQRRLAAQMEKDAVLRSLETGDGGVGGAVGSSGAAAGGSGLALISRGKANKLDRVYLRSLRPLMAKAKEVEEFVRGAGKAVSSVDVLEKLDYDLNMDAALLDELRLHPRVRVQEADAAALSTQAKEEEDEEEKKKKEKGGAGVSATAAAAAAAASVNKGAVREERKFFLLTYNATFDVRSRAELLQLVERLPDGIALKDLDGSYARILEDIKELQASGEVIAVCVMLQHLIDARVTRPYRPCFFPIHVVSLRVCVLLTCVPSSCCCCCCCCCCCHCSQIRTFAQMKGCIYREDENGGVTEEFPEIIYPGKHTLPIAVDNDIVDLYRYVRACCACASVNRSGLSSFSHRPRVFLYRVFSACSMLCVLEAPVAYTYILFRGPFGLVSRTGRSSCRAIPKRFGTRYCAPVSRSRRRTRR